MLLLFRSITITELCVNRLIDKLNKIIAIARKQRNEKGSFAIATANFVLISEPKFFCNIGSLSILQACKIEEVKIRFPFPSPSFNVEMMNKKQNNNKVTHKNELVN